MKKNEQLRPDPVSYVWFVKTNRAFHKGGFVFASLDEFAAAKDVLAREVAHLLQSEQAKDSSVELESWGAVNSTTGESVREFDSLADS